MPHSAQSKQTLRTGIAFCVLILLIYGSAITYDFSTWDDFTLILGNHFMMNPSWASVVHVFTTFDPELYIPFTRLTYVILNGLFGLNAGIFHGINVLLHMLTTLLLWQTVTKWTDRKAVGIGTALLFAVHPVNAEVVSWISGAKDAWMAFFFWLSAYLFHTSLERKSEKVYVGSIICFLFALLSKVTAATLPVILLLLYKTVGKKFGPLSWKRLLPYFCLSFVFGWIALFGKEQHLSGATANWPLIPTMVHSVLLQLWHAIFPINLAIFYPLTQEPQHFVFIGYLGALLLIGITIVALHKSVKGSFTAFGWLFFVITYALHVLSLQREEILYITYDRYGYLALIGLFIAVSSWVSSRKLQTINIGLVVLAMAALGSLSHIQSRTWKSDIALFSRATEVHPTFHRAHHLLGGMYMAKREFAHAIESYKQAVEQNGSYSHAWSALGRAYIETGQMDLAYEPLIKAIELAPETPFFHVNIALYYEALGDTAQMKRALQHALMLDPQLHIAQEKLKGVR